ncbi:ErfK/YbiS/YcfS/YnhG family protein [Thermincola ferriacetica]|uniref:ErfK/YbiS/YcfS/YnhG family protein n=1 Tax=Thermincola ferriacetica TaxID=281456 RepID=A0A0L6W0F6_9FIRM|nr:peptidoglycan-binding protein [Thermincola ferriacetica]KNZ68564.1 ErfK/YbiS/YcfS/YnhG family protein [Thermincola ferriacetica]
MSRYSFPAGKGIAFFLLATLIWFFSGEACYALHNPPCCPDECSVRALYLKKPPFSGSEVRDFQQALQYLGFYRGELDGVYGLQTYNAVKKFQRSNKLPVNGSINVATLRVLKKYFELPLATKTRTKGPKGEVRLEVHIKTRTLIVYDDDKVFKTYRVAVGRNKTPTPVGEWRIVRKAKNWGTGFGTRWLGLSVPWGLFGIHGTNKPWSIGSKASHGCIRMFNRDVEELYEWVKPGTRVTVIGQVFPVRYEDRLVIRRGYKGSDVYQVQQKLRELGYLKSAPDGIYGPATIAAVKKFQKDHDFPVTGEIDIDIYPAIGL